MFHTDYIHYFIQRNPECDSWAARAENNFHTPFSKTMLHYTLIEKINGFDPLSKSGKAPGLFIYHFWVKHCFTKEVANGNSREII
jgi:hypothetical protein